MQRYGDLFQIEVMFSTECLEFLKIIPLAEVSKQSFSKLKYAVCIYMYAFQICVRSFGYLKINSRQNAPILLRKKTKQFMLDSLNFKALFLVLFNKTVYLSL